MFFLHVLHMLAPRRPRSLNVNRGAKLGDAIDANVQINPLVLCNYDTSAMLNPCVLSIFADLDAKRDTDETDIDASYWFPPLEATFREQKGNASTDCVFELGRDV